MLLASVELRKLLVKMSDLWGIVVNNVGIGWMIRRVILVVSLGRIKGAQWNHLSHNRAREHASLIKLRDISLSNPLLFIAIVENN